MRLPLIVAAASYLAGCTTTAPEKTTESIQAQSFAVNKESVAPGTSVKRGGEPMKLAKGKLDLNKPMPAAALTDASWGSYSFKGDGKVRIVSFVPSVDTKVCEEQTHILGESQQIDPKVERVTVSRDLPPALKRFATEAKLTNVVYLSDFKSGAFGKASGLLIEDMGLLARGVAVVDGHGKVRYVQVVPELSQLPDMEKAIQVANKLANGQPL